MRHRTHGFVVQQLTHSSQLTGTHYERWPIHCHIDAMIIRPPLQILLMVSIVDRVVEFLIDLRQAVIGKHSPIENGCLSAIYAWG